jgi:hypothetical protein
MRGTSVLILLFCTLVAQAVPPQVQYVIGLSPFLSSNVKDVVYRRIISLTLEEIPLDSSVAIYDAYNLRTIALVEVPSVAAFRSAKTRANQFKEPIRRLREFLATTNAFPAAPGRLRFENAVRLPQFLDFVAENVSHGTNAIRLIVLGSPLYMDAKEPGFSMADGYFPSDGHLLAGREQSVYGLKERSGALRDCVLHLGYFGDPWVSDVHREKISRFWSLYLSRQSARLATLSGDLPTVFQAAVANSGSERAHQVDPGQTKVEMLRVTRDIGIADWITRDVLPNSPVEPPSITVGPMKIGIRWRGNVDLDLYAAASSRSETLYFEHTRAPEGYYFKDHRSSPEREYEFIEFESPVDVWQVNASINFYEGRAPGGASGEIRIEFDGRIYSGHFSLPAERGNKGREGTRQRDFWTRINVPEILKLKRDQAALK